MTEAEWQTKVVETAQWFGWRVAHFENAQNRRGRYGAQVRYDGKGFPDLVLVHPERWLTLFRELKTDRGKLTPEQEAWGKALLHGASDYEVWRPSDWPVVLHTLSGGAASAVGVPGATAVPAGR